MNSAASEPSAKSPERRSADTDLSTDSDALASWLQSRCDNRGRWGLDDQLGTMNLITPDVRVRAASLVRSGRLVSLAKPIDTVASVINVRPAWHVMHLETERPYASADSLHLQIHGLAVTHLDSLGHMFLDGIGYNGAVQAEVVDMGGLRRLDIGVMAGGILTRGVLLDLTRVVGADWLEPGEYVDASMLEQAATDAGISVEAGDAVFVHVGLERRERALGPEDPAIRAGLSLDAVGWLFDHDVALYSGDCIERFPETGTVAPMPLHQIGIARMGLALLDAPAMTPLVDAVAAERRAEFMITMAPLNIPGGTGSPVNPLALF